MLILTKRNNKITHIDKDNINFFSIKTIDSILKIYLKGQNASISSLVEIVELLQTSDFNNVLYSYIKYFLKMLRTDAAPGI